MSNESMWKEALLSSAIPIAFEAAQILVEKGFSVVPDFRFSVFDHGKKTDRHVDIHAFSMPCVSGSQTKDARLDILVQCAHFSREAILVFLSDPNPEASSPVIPGNTLRVIDNFSSRVLDMKAGEYLDRGIAKALSGVVLETRLGSAEKDSVTRHVELLQFGLPRLITENTLEFMLGAPEQNIPFMIAPVLISSAPLYVTKEGVTTEEIIRAGALEEVCAEKPCVLYYSRYGPDFEATVRNEAESLRILLHKQRAMSIEMKRARYYKTQVNLPFTIIDSFIQAKRYYLEAFFSQFFIVHSSHFPVFTDEIRNTSQKILETGKQIE